MNFQKIKNGQKDSSSFKIHGNSKRLTHTFLDNNFRQKEAAKYQTAWSTNVDATASSPICTQWSIRIGALTSDKEFWKTQVQISLERNVWTSSTLHSKMRALPKDIRSNRTFKNQTSIHRKTQPYTAMGYSLTRCFTITSQSKWLQVCAYHCGQLLTIHWSLFHSFQSTDKQ